MSLSSCEENFNGRIVLQPAVNTSLDIDIVGISPIKVNKSMRGTTTVYTISLHVLTAPTTSMSVTPSYVEFNTPFTATYTAVFSMGSDAISTKTLIPQSSPVADLTTSPVVFTESATPLQIGKQYVHTLTVTDVNGLTASSSAGIDVFYRYFKGVIPRNATLSVSGVSAFAGAVGASITSVFGAKSHYINASGVEAHFAWLRPLNSPVMGTPVGDGNFPYETAIEPYTLIINGAEYAVIKTINFYPTSTDVELSF